MAATSSMPNAQWRMAQVAQDMPETEQSATDFVIEGDTALLAAQQRSAPTPKPATTAMRMAHAYMALHDAGAHDAESRAQALILGLGFKTTELDNPVNSFSGGWRMRLQLARALMCPSDLLLLDEPTNHLDLDALVWLEAWLKRYPGTLVVISHDREFLDAITEVTLHIDNAKLVRYGGNYSKFEDMRAEQMLLQQNALAKQAGEDRPPAKSSSTASRPRPARPSRRRAGSRRWIAWRRSRRCWPMPNSLRIQGAANLPNPMLSMVIRQLGYPPPEDAPAGTPPTVIVRNINRSVMAGQRIGILGANGQGKSTLVKTIARDAGTDQRRSHRRQGPEHRLLRPAGTRRAAPAGQPARTHGPPGQGSHRRRQAAMCRAASRTCAISSAPSISAATWSSRPSAP
jgi:ATP-binding cassette subfamily F protein 3